MENESSSDIHRSQTAFPNKRRPNHLETMPCQLLLHKPLLHLMLKPGSYISSSESDRIWLWMKNTLKEKRNREKQEKDADEPVATMKRVTLLTSSGEHGGCISMGLYMLLSSSQPNSSGASDIQDSPAHQFTQSLRTKMISGCSQQPQWFALQYSLAESIRLCMLGMQVFSYLLVFLLWVDGTFDIKLTTL